MVVFFIGMTLATQALAAQSPDELYRQGHFAEAEKAYARSDMDHPGDIRFRYNRGCAAYQNSDYQGAMAAFSSVLRRAKDDETRFSATYNLGNISYKKGDFESAVAYYRQSIRYDPGNEDARHNLELALRKLEDQKKDKSKKEKEGSQKNSGKRGNKEGQSKGAKEGGEQGRPPQKGDAGQTPSQAKGKADNKGQSGSGQGGESKREKGVPKDLSGKLEPLHSLTGEKGEGGSQGQALSMMDKKAAQALLDNIKEDRSRFLRFLVPEEKRHGVGSGKDW